MNNALATSSEISTSLSRSYERLRDYQQDFIDTLFVRDHTLGWVPIGAGKTICVLTAAAELITEGYLRAVLVVAPLRVCRHVWRQEAAKWAHTAHLKVVHVAGLPGVRQRLLADNDTDVYLINYELLPWLATELKRGLSLRADGLVFDEVTKMRKAGSRRFRLFRGQLKRFGWRVGLTGSPQPRNLLDLWGPAFAVGGPKYLGKSFSDYQRDHFYMPDPYGYTWEPLPGAPATILDRLAPLIYQPPPGVVKAHPVITNDIVVDLLLEGRRAYQQLETELFTQLEDANIEAGTAGVLVQKLLQAASGFLYDATHEDHWIDEAKLAAVTDIVADLQGEPCIIVYQHQAMAAHLLVTIPGSRALGGAYGNKTMLGELELINEWRAGRVPVLLMHPASAGHGIDGLQHGGRHLIFVSLPWDMELYQQSIGRLARSGQTETVYAHRILAADTIDGAVAAVLADREAGQADLLRAVRKKSK